jgi:hypothetical protein
MHPTTRIDTTIMSLIDGSGARTPRSQVHARTLLQFGEAEKSVTLTRRQSVNHTPVAHDPPWLVTARVKDFASCKQSESGLYCPH